MSRARHEEMKHHEKRKDGGGIGGVGKVKEESYAGTGSDTEKEAEKRKRGGSVKKGKMPHMVHGRMPHHHMNRPGRKRGGSMGADSHPMTEASRLEKPEGLNYDTKVNKEDD
jgi:hypothetical protein